MQTKSKRRARVRQNRPRKDAPRYRSGGLKPEDPRKTAVDARLRHAKLPDTPESRADMLQARQGCAIGRALDGKPALWQAVCHARAVVLAYDRACGAPDRHAQVARILAPRDTLQATAETPPRDERTEDEKYRQAVAAWTRLQGWISHCDGAACTAFNRAVIDEIDAPIRDLQGVLNVLAGIAEGLAGEVVKARVRK